MGCCGGDREKALRNDVRWEYVNFNDFKSTSCWTPFAYIYLWLMLFVSISVYAVDTFTAINLLAFNKWAGQIQPFLKFEYSRWIFAGCIILSFILLAYRWMRALKVIRGGTVAKSYLDPLAIRVQSIRMGAEGKGWKRFLVFAELTKSRKGADYVALFAFYSFEAWLRICFAEGPRQVINGITLYTVMQADLIPHSDADSEGRSPFVQFWVNVGAMADKNKLSAVVLFGMVWTVLIWVISAISLAVSVILYLIFLWHHIPTGSGGLSGYCRSKINRRMERIVKVKTDKALKKENEIRARQEARAFRDGFNDVKRQPTLPDLAGTGTPTSSLPPLSRQTTMTTLPEYHSRPGTAMSSADTLPPMPTPSEAYRPGPRRHMTNASDASWSSYNSNAPLMSQAGDFGYSPADRAHTPSSAVSTPWSARPGGPHRGFPSTSEFSDRSMTPGPSRPTTAQSGRHTPGTYQMEPLSRPGTSMSNAHWNGRMSADSETLPPPVPRYQTPLSAGPSPAPLLPDNHARRTPAPANNPYFPPISPIQENTGRESPSLSLYSQQSGPSRPYTPGGPPPRAMTPGTHAPPLPRLHTSNAANSNSGYIPFNPNRDASLTPHSGGSRWDRAPPPQRGGSVEDIISHY